MTDDAGCSRHHMHPFTHQDHDEDATTDHNQVCGLDMRPVMVSRAAVNPDGAAARRREEGHSSRADPQGRLHRVKEAKAGGHVKARVQAHVVWYRLEPLLSTTIGYRLKSGKIFHYIQVPCVREV